MNEVHVVLGDRALETPALFKTSVFVIGNSDYGQNHV